MDSLYKRGIPCVVAKGISELGYGAGEYVLGDELGRPHGVDQPLPFDQIARVLGQTDQHIHHLELDLDGVLAPGQAVQSGFDKPVAEAVWAMARSGSFDCVRHVETNIACQLAIRYI